MNEKNEFDQLKGDCDEEEEVEEEPSIELEPEERQKLLIEKVKLKNKILRYKELFPHLLQNFNYRLEDLDNLDNKQLSFLIEELSVIVNTRNSSGLTKMLYFETARVFEFGGRFVGLKVDGLQTALKENQAIHDVLNEISLKYENDMYMAPEIRLGYLTAQTILSLHKLNSSQNVISNFLSEKIPETIKKEFEDL